MRLRRLLILLLCPLLIAAQPVLAGDQNGARQFIEDMARKVVSVLENKDSLAQKDAELKQVFEGNIAIDWVGRFVLGRHWRTATPEQQQAYLASYKSFIINSYVDRLKEYSGETFTIQQTRDLGDNQFILSMEIARPNVQAPVLVDYKVRDENGRYQVYDIVVEGVSLITTQRSEFDAVVSRKGLDYLINQLSAKAEANAAG
jgi:phospholipid transport system substrate-binding protein